MASYYINDRDLRADFGICVEDSDSWSRLPKRKGKGYHSFPDQNGIEPWVDEEDIKFESRDIALKCVLLADSIGLANTLMHELFLELAKPRILSLRMNVLDKSIAYGCTFLGGGSVQKITNSVGKVGFRFTLNLKDIDPTKNIKISNYVDESGEDYTDLSGNNLYGYE